MFDAEIMPIWIGLFILIAILIPCVSALRVYSRYRKVAKALPTPASIKRTKPTTLDAKRDLLATELLEDWDKLPASEIEVTRHALWTAMLLESVSDGSIDTREIDFVADLFGKLSGQVIETELTMEAAERVHGDQKAALLEISNAGGVGNASKGYILSGAFLVSLSDHALAESETDCLGDIADALAISQRDRKAIFSGITKRLGI